MEQEEYTKEEIDWSYIEFVDNQDVLDLIEKVIFNFFTLFTLNSECQFYTYTVGFGSQIEANIFKEPTNHFIYLAGWLFINKSVTYLIQLLRRNWQQGF